MILVIEQQSNIAINVVERKTTCKLNQGMND